MARCRRLDVDGDELGLVQVRLRADLGASTAISSHGTGFGGPARLEEDGLHDCRLNSAERRN